MLRCLKTGSSATVCEGIIHKMCAYPQPENKKKKKNGIISVREAKQLITVSPKKFALTY